MTSPLGRRAAAAALVSTFCLGGCGGGGPDRPPPADPAGALAAAAGRLDGVTTFRLTLDTAVPPAAAPSAGSAGPAAAYRISLSGMWNTVLHDGAMTGRLNGVGSTVLAADGVEYVSLAPGSGPAGKSWLKVDGAGTFGAFDDPHLVAQLLRAYHGLDGSRPGHVTGTILTAEADQHIADPDVLASLTGYPDAIAFDVALDRDGAPTSVSFRLDPQAGRTSGSVALLDFGAPAPDVRVPTADQVVQAPAPA